MNMAKTGTPDYILFYWIVDIVRFLHCCMVCQCMYLVGDYGILESEY